MILHPSGERGEEVAPPHAIGLLRQGRPAIWDWEPPPGHLRSLRIGGRGVGMRSPFAIWSDDGRVDYGVERPKLPRAKRFGIAIVAFAVAGLGVWNAYSAIVANLKVRDSSDVREAANRQAESHDPAAEANREAANRPA